MTGPNVTPDNRWNDNSIQFPRLIAEIIATIEIADLDWAALRDSMDLTDDQLIELFDRAQTAWDKQKASL
jgi:hypothetical protein